MFCKANKIPSPLQEKFTENLKQMVRQGFLQPVQPRGVTSGVAEKEERRDETLCGLESAYQRQRHA